MSRSFAELFACVQAGWPCDAQHYPVRIGLSSEEQTLFDLNHLLKHRAESLGVLGRRLEQVDHLSCEKRAEAVHKMRNDPHIVAMARRFLADSLKLAEICGISAETLEEALITKYSPQPPSPTSGPA